MWMAGGGIKSGFTHGETDEIDYSGINGRVHVHDLQATILNQLGLDHERTTYRFQGRDYRLTDVHGNVIRARENVMHEIGFFQGKYGLDRVCLLYEDGTNIPSNIHGLVYIRFPKDVITATFGKLSREIKAYFK